MGLLWSQACGINLYDMFLQNPGHLFLEIGTLQKWYLKEVFFSLFNNMWLFLWTVVIRLLILGGITQYKRMVILRFPL